jgi:hypothetical protein
LAFDPLERMSNGFCFYYTDGFAVDIQEIVGFAVCTGKLRDG